MYCVDGLRFTFTLRPCGKVDTRPSRSSLLKPEMAILPSRVAGSIGVANCMPTPKRPALCWPFAGTVDATAGRPTVVNDEVRSSEVSPPRAPRSPFSTDTTYLDDSPSRTVGLKVATVTSSFQLIRPGTAAPVRSRTAMPPATERSIDWLKVIATS